MTTYWAICLRPYLFLPSREPREGNSAQSDLGANSAAAALASMSLEQKRTLLKKVLRSPQFNQSLLSLTNALREGGLPSISEALGISIENGGNVRGGSVPLGGGDAVEAFVEGVKKNSAEEVRGMGQDRRSEPSRHAKVAGSHRVP